MKRVHGAVLFLLLAGCASAPSTPRMVRPTANAIGAEELAVSTASDLLELIRETRPHWLPRADRREVDVYLLDSRIGGVRELRSYRPQDVEGIDFLGAAEAGFRFPDARGIPVIVLVPKEVR